MNTFVALWQSGHTCWNSANTGTNAGFIVECCMGDPGKLSDLQRQQTEWKKSRCPANLHMA